MHLTDKDMINLITHYFYSGSFEFENNLLIAQNLCNLHADKNNLLELYKCQIAMDTYKKICEDIEKILFD